MKAEPKRCAVYTRKSSDEGLEQEFNSLDAQREAGEAYVTSQASEGWKLLPNRYDDGGFSGGSMERPGLKALFAEIALGKIDVVVVYKIDRLTRSLGDFARMVELFDKHKVSFVSVTQSFNTTSSMGRLTLNVLLSFAQFEREVTGERIRDKIAASKAKGMWMGGTLPLGYDKPSGTSRILVVNKAEAETVRLIFRKYLELCSVSRLQSWLHDNGVVSKMWVTEAGRNMGGNPFARGALFHMLRNQTYRGMIVHRDKAHPGLHEPIVDEHLFNEVQDMLNAYARRHNCREDRVMRAPLVGRLFDGSGNPMTPSFTHRKRGQVYRYYVSAPLNQGGRKGNENLKRVPATAMERVVERQVARLVPTYDRCALSLPTRIEVHDRTVQILLPVEHLPAIREKVDGQERVEIDPGNPNSLRLSIPIRMQRHGGKRIIKSSGPADPQPDEVLIKALRTAHSMLETDHRGMPVLQISPVAL
jgi:site-specific DNA recombinase